MSEPYIRFWAADMRGDPEMLVIGLAGQALLAHAWDLAKNGPQCPDLRMPNGKPMKSGQFSALIPGSSRSQCARFFGQILDLNLAEKTADGALTFPKMPYRQGIDMTATERQRRRRLRLKSQEDVTAVSRPMSRSKSRPRHGDVTAQSTEERTGKEEPSNEASPYPPKSRKPDPIWDALLDACPAGSDMTKSERGRRNAACRELREINAQPADVRRVAKHLRQKWGDRVAITPSGIVSNWSGALAEIQPNGNGRTWTAEDAERAAATRRQDEERLRREKAESQTEEVPY